MVDNRGAADAGDAIPMQKTGTTTYVAVGVGVLAIGGVLAMTLGGGSDPEAEKRAQEIKAAAEAKPENGMSAKEQREHMKMTAAAFQQAELKAQEKKAAEAQAKAAQAAEEQEKAQVGAVAAAAPPPKPKVSGKAKKKQMDGLDSIGSDITSALK